MGFTLRATSPRCLTALCKTIRAYSRWGHVLTVIMLDLESPNRFAIQILGRCGTIAAATRDAIELLSSCRTSAPWVMDVGYGLGRVDRVG